MSFIQGAIFENGLMYGAGRYKHELVDIGASGSFDQTQSPEDILPREFDHIPFLSAKSFAGAIECCVYDG
jgi:hypothetical protein